MTNVTKACHDPKSVYSYPQNVLDDHTITREQKVKILKQWEYDARELQVAEEENMTGNSSPSMLNRVLQALNKLEGVSDSTGGSGTKHGA